MPLQESVEPRSIYQFHYTGWPDHGVPDDPSSVLNILEDVNIKQDHTEGAGPIVVHCRWDMIEGADFCERNGTTAHYTLSVLEGGFLYSPVDLPLWVCWGRVLYSPVD